MKYQRGFSILEIIVVLGIIGFMTTLAMSSSKYEANMIQARALGLELYEVHNSARRFAALNSTNPDLRTSGSIIIEDGLSWLKSQEDCGGSANSNFLSCDHPESTTIGAFTYSTELDPTVNNNTLKIKTVIDVKGNFQGMSTHFSEEMLGLSAITARGGATATSISIGGVNSTSSDPSMANTSSLVLYCMEGIDKALLHEECTGVNSDTIEGGLIVMITQSNSTSSSWLLTNGGNSMHNSLDFDSANPEFREIVGVDRMYNLTGEVLRLGNSGVYYDSGDFLPILGSGLVIDTDVYSIGDIKNLGDVEVEGDILTKGNVFSDGAVYAKGPIISESDLEVWGDQYVLGQTFLNGNTDVFGTLSADRIRSNTFIEAREISADGGIYAGQLVNAPVVRAAASLVSEGDLTVAGDTVIGGSEYVEGSSITQGTLYSGSDIIADTGTAYLNNVFASAIYDNDGTYMLDPSGISRLNIMRADKIAPSTSGGTLALNSNNILFASESNDCTAASEDCATALEGYWDIENLHVKNTETGEWERLVDWIARIQSASESEDAGTDPDTGSGSANDIDCRTGFQDGRRGAFYEGIFHPYATCP